MDGPLSGALRMLSVVSSLAFAGLVAAFPSGAVAQQAEPSSLQRTIDAGGVLGFSTFIDDDFIEHVVAGGSVRLGMTRRWSIEPQFLYMRANDRDEDYYLLGNLIYDLAERGRVTPYWIVGGGAFWHRARFGRGHSQTFTSQSWHFSGGAGARIRLDERWSVTSEARVGLEPFFQVHFGLRYSF